MKLLIVDHSILNVIAVVHEQSYLINVINLNKCNHQTFSKGIIDSVSDIGIESKNVRFIVTGAAAYCKKGYRDVLPVIYNRSQHVLCMAHQFNLIGDIFKKAKQFRRLALFVGLFKSAFNKKSGRKYIFLEFLNDSLTTF